VSLRWIDHGPATGYEVERAKDGAFTSNVVAYILPAGASSYTVGGLAAGTKYYFRVRALGVAGSGDSPYSTPLAVTTPHAPPAAALAATTPAATPAADERSLTASARTVADGGSVQLIASGFVDPFGGGVALAPQVSSSPAAADVGGSVAPPDAYRAPAGGRRAATLAATGGAAKRSAALIIITP
jgi:hypothetical protein